MADTINQYLKELVQKNIDKLVKAKCVEFDKEESTLMPTTLGYLASFYYLSHETIEQFGEDIKSQSSVS